MPFRTIGSGTDYAFSLGLAEEITTAFSHFRPIVCVAPASVAVLADEPDRQTERWQQLDLDFLVDGSFRKKGNDIRVLLRLFNMRGAGEISWGRRFDSLMPDVLNLQDQIASETAAQVAPELVVWEGREAASRRQVDPTAYDLILRAIPATYCVDEAGFREAGALLERSLALDPSSAVCHAWLAHWYLWLSGQGWATDIALAAERADSLSQQAIILDPGDARAFAVAGQVRAYLRKDAEAALWLHERAIDLNPNLAIAWCYSGLAHSYLGQHSEAIRRIQHAQRLSPFDPLEFLLRLGSRDRVPSHRSGRRRGARRPTGPRPQSRIFIHLQGPTGRARSPWRAPGGRIGPQGTYGVGAQLVNQLFSRAVTLPEAGRSPSVRSGVAPSRDTRAIQALRSIGRDRRGHRGVHWPTAKWTFALAALPGGDCVGTERTIKGFCWRHHCCAVRAPVLVGHSGHVGHDVSHIEGLLGIGLPRQGLYLKQWEIGSQVHGLMRSSETEVGEKRTEPPICLNDAFIEAVAAGGCQIRRRTHQHAPFWNRAYHQSGPDLHDA